MLAICVLLGALGFSNDALSAEQDAVFLVASKQMDDPRFVESVILVAHRDKGGALGLILNRPTKFSVDHLFQGDPLGIGSGASLFFGGPVSPNSIFFLFKSSEPQERAVRAFGQTYLSSDPKLLREKLNQPKGHEELRVFFGYTGWAPGQLDFEIQQGSWHVVPAEESLLFRPDSASIWRELIAQLAGKWI